MASNSTISVTFKMAGDVRSFQQLTNNSEDFRKALQGALVEADKLPKSLGGLTTASKIAGAAGAAMGTAFVKVLGDMVRETQILGDVWSRETAGMKAAYQEFIGTLASGDFQGLADRIRGAFGAGRGINMAEDASTEQMYAIRLKKSAITKEQELLREQLNNQQLSYDQRRQAAQKYLDNIRPIYAEMTEMYGDLYRAQVYGFLGSAGISQDSGNVAKLRKYLLNGAQIPGASAGDSDYQAIDREFQKRNDGRNEALVSAIEQFEASQGAFEAENRRIITSLNSLGAQASKVAKEEKTLATAIDEYNESVRQAVLVSSTLGSAQDSIDAQLAAMKTGLAGLIKQYGVEDESVQALVERYKALARARSTMGGYDLTKIDQFGTFGKESGGLKGLPVQEAKEYAENLSGVQTTLTAVSSIFSDMSGVMEDNAKGWISWISTVLTSVAQAVPAIQALVQARKAEANANLEASASGAASSVASIPFVGPVLAVAAVASVLASLASLPKFAKGGIAYGPTLGLFGEYSGASNNPEVVAPLDRLRSLIGDTQGAGKVEFVIEGRTLKGIMKKMNELDRRS